VWAFGSSDIYNSRNVERESNGRAKLRDMPTMEAAMEDGEETAKMSGSDNVGWWGHRCTLNDSLFLGCLNYFLTKTR
jgi:hypothetical protein